MKPTIISKTSFANLVAKLAKDMTKANGEFVRLSDGCPAMRWSINGVVRIDKSDASYAWRKANKDLDEPIYITAYFYAYCEHGDPHTADEVTDGEIAGINYTNGCKVADIQMFDLPNGDRLQKAFRRIIDGAVKNGQGKVANTHSNRSTGIKAKRIEKK